MSDMTMTDNIKQQISALIDGELSSAENNTLLSSLKDNPELKATWGRYHLISDALRGEQIQVEVFNIAERVRARIDDEPAIISIPKSRDVTHSSEKDNGVHWLKPAVGVALAASVAGAVIMVMPDFSTNPGQIQPMQVADSNTTTVAPQPMQLVASISPVTRTYSQSSGTRWKNLAQPEIESKLNRYLVDHNELASPSGMTGVLPYASFVSYDSNQ